MFRKGTLEGVLFQLKTIYNNDKTEIAMKKKSRVITAVAMLLLVIQTIGCSKAESMYTQITEIMEETEEPSLGQSEANETEVLSPTTTPSSQLTEEPKSSPTVTPT